MLDWGEPDERDADNRLEDYVDDYIPAAIDRVLELSGADEVNLFGYCFGGNLTLLYAAHHPTPRCAASRCWPPRSTSGTWARWPTSSGWAG